ncbi:hypothetical protein DSO57_1039114 [Entomophthora muscae]|uniref:Uncharacterized protein n=1 Tax=Entomophthora muscae TaxID=34485 RepID=A0ACC2U843_9FUNG|nr:hypothetical protein DSO57_1039114 [Entomophthora muscae]
MGIPPAPSRRRGSPCSKWLFRQHCKRATCLEIHLSHNEHEEAILLLATKLPRLKSIKVCARFKEDTLDMLSPVINRVERLTLESISQPHCDFLIGLTGPSAKAISLLGLNMDIEDFVELINGVDSLEKFHYSPIYGILGHFGFSYNARQQRFEEIHLVDEFVTVVTDVQFKPAPAPNP